MLGKAFITIGANLKPLQTALAKGHKMMVDSMKSMAGGALKGIGNILVSGLKTIVSAAKYAAAALLGIGVASVKMAIDNESAIATFNALMGDSADEARKWAESFSKSIRGNDSDVMLLTGTLYGMLDAMGIANDKAIEMSKGMTELSYDLASARSMSPQEAFSALQGAMTGMARGVKRFGIDISEVAVKEYALANGMVKVVSSVSDADFALMGMNAQMAYLKEMSKKTEVELTEEQKAIAIYAMVMDKTKNIQGHFAKNTGLTRNALYLLKMAVVNTGEAIGGVFLPMVGKATDAIAKWLDENRATITDWAEKIKSSMQVAMDEIAKLIGMATEGDWKGVFTAVGEIIARMANAFYEWISKMMPMAITLGEQIGTGFYAAIEKTPFGAFLKKWFGAMESSSSGQSRASVVGATAGGAAVGATIGSVVPGVGTAAGAAAGAGVGYSAAAVREIRSVFLEIRKLDVLWEEQKAQNRRLEARLAEISKNTKGGVLN